MIFSESVAKIDNSYCDIIVPDCAIRSIEDPNCFYLKWVDCDTMLVYIKPKVRISIYEKFQNGRYIGIEQKVQYPEHPIPGFLGTLGSTENGPGHYILTKRGVNLISRKGILLKEYGLDNMQYLPKPILDVILRRYYRSLTEQARQFIWDMSSVGRIISYKEAKEIYDDL